MDTSKVKQKLIDMRKELIALSETASLSRDTVKLDQSAVGRLSRMDALQQQAMAKATEARRSKQLYRIDHALRLIESGEYGICENCDEDIAPKRLEIDPLATRCTNCAG